MQVDPSNRSSQIVTGSLILKNYYLTQTTKILIKKGQESYLSESIF